MDLSSLELWATFFRHAIVILGLGGSTAGFLAWYHGKTNEAKQRNYQFRGIFLGVCAVIAAYQNFELTDRVAKVKEEEFQRFKLDKDIEIKNLDAENLKLRNQLGDLEKYNLTFRNKVATLEANAEQQRARAAKAEKELLELQEKLKARSLTPHQREILLTALTPYKGQRLHIVEYALSREAKAFSSQLQSVFVAAEWDTKVIGVMSGAEARPGVVIMVDVGEENVVATLLAETLQKLGIKSQLLGNATLIPHKLGQGTIGMLVGPKP
jgi:hypothetical protein